MSGIISGLRNRLWILPALCILTIVIGQLCASLCAFIEGDILGIDLNVFGILFYSMLLAALLAHKKLYPRERLMQAIAAVVSAGMGAELVLIKFQIDNNVYCPKCLVSGFFFLVLFLLIARQLKKWVVILLVAAGVIFASFTFSGSVVPSYADEHYPRFGLERADVTVIIYSDYFCPYCGKLEGPVNAKLLKLQKSISIQFVDVPLHKGSLEYAEVFLYAWFASGSNLETALKVREVLFDAAEKKLDQAGAIAALSSKGLEIKVDKDRARRIFLGFYNVSLKKDGVNATPTVVIEKNGERKKYKGNTKILSALEELSVP